jgi:hypothetical protein
MAKIVAHFNFSAFLEKEKLKPFGSNFTDWHRNFGIILTICKKSYVLAELGDTHGEQADKDKLKLHDN